MYNLKNGSLTMGDNDLDNLSDKIEGGCNPKEALKNELEAVGIELKDVYNIMLKGNQSITARYTETYAKIICEFWNKK